MSTLSVGILVFPKVQQLDLTGPYEVFASVPESDVCLVWKRIEPIVSATGLTLTPDVTFNDSPQFDVLCVPGGPGVNPLMEDDDTINFVRKQAAGARYVTSICTGSLILGAAGVLEGRKATTHWASHDFLSRLGAEPVKARVVRDGNLFTGGGVTAGIDMALTGVAEMFGLDAAEAVQLNLEYAPEPPFEAGHPETAPASVLEIVRGRGQASRAERERIVERVEAARTADPAGGRRQA